MQFFIFYKNMHEEILEFICMHTNKTYFLCFWNEKSFEFFKISKKNVFLILSLYLIIQVYSLILSEILWKKDIFLYFLNKKFIF